MNSKVNILGTEYSIEKHTRQDDVKLTEANGYSELMIKKLVICDFEDNPNNLEDMESYSNKVARHEITHAFMYESGLHACNEFALDETLIDWIAIQGPKLYKAWKEAGVV